MHKKRLIFTDLYNLHLEIASVLMKPQKTMKTFLGQKEREKLLGFFKKHDSKQVKYTTATQVRRKCTGPDGKIRANISEMSNLGWYEHMTRAKEDLLLFHSYKRPRNISYGQHLTDKQRSMFLDVIGRKSEWRGQKKEKKGIGFSFLH